MTLEGRTPKWLLNGTDGPSSPLWLAGNPRRGPLWLCPDAQQLKPHALPRLALHPPFQAQGRGGVPADF